MTRFDKDKYLRKIKLKRYNKYFYLGIVCLFCLIIGLYFTYSKFSVSKDTEVVKTTVGEFLYGDIIVGAYINGEYSSTFPKKDDGYKVEKIICDNNSTGTWNNDAWGIVVSNLTKRTKCNVYFMSDIQVDFDYTGGKQTFTVPVSGTYKLETWGAIGGNSVADGVMQSNGGYGGYSIGYVFLNTNDNIYINVGGKGQDGFINQNDILGGYNGGGISHWDKNDNEASGGGGGATHIATKSGLLSSLKDFKSSILIVSGGGGGGSWLYTAGFGGGYVGTSSLNPEHNTESLGGSQLNGYSFGVGGSGIDHIGSPGGGGGGGYYGGYGGTSDGVSGGGGSGYIGNSLLKNKAMYCYNCQESNEENTKTISTTCSEETPTENCAKKGNGYARITLVSNE